ncbi:MAG: transglutaminase-like domain-containing protein, partial [Pseudoclavibacter sp.]
MSNATGASTTTAGRAGGAAEGDVERPRFTPRGWIDLGVFAGLILVAMLGFQSPFGGWWFMLATAGGLIVGVGAALLGQLWRLNTLNTVLIGIAGYFVLGTAFALPLSGFFAVLPTFQTLAALALGAVRSWRDIITLQPPVEGPDETLVLPYIATFAVALAGSILILRWLQRHPRSVGRAAVILTLPFALFVLTVIVGTAQPFLGLLRGLAIGLAALVWLGWRRGLPNVAGDDARRGLWRRRLAGTAVLAIAAGAVTGGAGALTQPLVDSDRFVLRDEVTPPFDPFLYESPLAGFRTYTKELRDTVLFKVGGLQAGDSLRLAVLDSYTGKKWEIADPNLGMTGAGTYNLVGRDVPESTFITSSSSRQIEVHVENYDDIWLPTVGAPNRIDLLIGNIGSRRSELRYNGQTGTGLIMGGIGAGDIYAITADMQDFPLDGQLDNTPVANIDLPPAAAAPAALVERMQTFIQGETSPYLQLRAIEQAFTSQGYLSHGTASDFAPSRAGHGLDRMQELFDLRYMIGDAEQYASAMALMARELGYPARVVMGLSPESIPEGGGLTDVHGSDITAWVEVPFEGFGWVRFDPTPEQTDVPVNTVSDPQTKPRAQVRQPPQTEERPDDLITAADRPEDEDDKLDESEWPRSVWANGIADAVPLVLYVIPLLVYVIIRAI